MNIPEGPGRSREVLTRCPGTVQAPGAQGSHGRPEASGPQQRLGGRVGVAGTYTGRCHPPPRRTLTDQDMERHGKNLKDVSHELTVPTHRGAWKPLPFGPEGPGWLV